MVLLTLNLLATYVGASDDEDVEGSGGEEGSGELGRKCGLELLGIPGVPVVG